MSHRAILPKFSRSRGANRETESDGAGPQGGSKLVSGHSAAGCGSSIAHNSWLRVWSLRTVCARSGYKRLWGRRHADDWIIHRRDALSFGQLAALRVALFSSANESLKEALQVEMSNTWILALASLILAWTMATIAYLTSPEIGRLVFAWIGGSTLWIITIPYTNFASGTMQALGRDGANSAVALAGCAAEIALGAIVFLVLRPSLATALFVASFGSGVMSIVFLLYRVQYIQRVVKFRFNFRARLNKNWPRSLWFSVMAGLDGLVYMLVFSAAVIIASGYSPASGAAVAGAVAVARLFILPVKQLGFVGGRWIAQGVMPPADGLRFVRLVSFIVCAACALLFLSWAIISTSVPIALALLVALQLTLEPVAGVEYAVLKVAAGPQAGVLWLIVCYGVLAPLGLIAIAGFEIGEAWIIWSLLLLVRALFALGALFLTRRLTQSVASAERA